VRHVCLKECRTWLMCVMCVMRASGASKAVLIPHSSYIGVLRLPQPTSSHWSYPGFVDSQK